MFPGFSNWRTAIGAKKPGVSRALLLALYCRLPLLLGCLFRRGLLGGCLLRRGLLRNCLLGNCLLRRSLFGNCFLHCCLLGGRLLCCLLDGQLFTSFGEFAGALAGCGLLGYNLSAPRTRTALLCGGFLRSLFGHNLFCNGLLSKTLLRRSLLGYCLLCWSLLGRSLPGYSFLRWNLLGNCFLGWSLPGCRFLRRSLLGYSFLYGGLLGGRLCFRRLLYWSRRCHNRSHLDSHHCGSLFLRGLLSGRLRCGFLRDHDHRFFRSEE